MSKNSERGDYWDQFAPSLPPTNWDDIVVADRESKPTQSREAWERLAMSYWGPLFSFARRSGRGEDQAMDDVQDFFHHLLVNKRVGRADPALGKFRSFLLTVFKRFLIDKWRREKWEKLTESLEQRLANAGPEAEPRDPSDPDREFHQNCAFTLLNLALVRLEKEEQAAGREEIFAVLRTRLDGKERLSYEQLAGELGVSAETLRVAVHRLKKRLKAIVRDEIMQTLDPRCGATELEEELHVIQNYLSDAD